MYALLRHPDELQKLRSEPSLMPHAVHEMMRYDGPAHFSHTKFTTDSTLCLSSMTVTLPAGTAVMPILSSANHDPAHFADPDKLDIARGKIRHFGFSAGVHTCLGTNLARMETEIAIPAFLDRFKHVALDGDVEWAVHGNLRGLKRLPITVSTAET
jgi:cytochrome P450